MEKHTKEPWKEVGAGPDAAGMIVGGDGSNVINWRGISRPLSPVGKYNVARIVACVNACAGIPIEALEAGVIGEMIEALKSAANMMWDNSGLENSEEYAAIDAVLTKLGVKE